VQLTGLRAVPPFGRWVELRVVAVLAAQLIGNLNDVSATVLGMQGQSPDSRRLDATRHAARPGPSRWTMVQRDSDLRARVRFRWVCSGVSWGPGCSSSLGGTRGGVAGWLRGP